MSSMIQPNYGTRTYSLLTTARETKLTETQGSSFLELAALASSTTAAQQTDAAQMDAYKKYLETRFGPVTVQSVGKDQASLEAAGKHMSGLDIIIAPNIFAEMVADSKKAAYYEQKISYFFTDVIPNGRAFVASVGLTFEPCGVVIHEDGTVTYICGGGDSLERVAEVNRINAEKAKKKAEQQRLYQELAAAAAAQRRAVWERTAETVALEKTFFKIGDWLKSQLVSAPTITPEVSLPAGTNLFFLDL